MAYRDGEDLFYITYEATSSVRGAASMPMSFEYGQDRAWSGGERLGSTLDEIRAGRRTSTLRSEDEFSKAARQGRGYEKGKVYRVGDGTYVKIKAISRFNPKDLTADQWAKISETERWSVDWLVEKYGNPEVLTEANTTPEITKNLPETAATVAQGIEQGTSKPLAAGSNPAGGATPVLRPGIPGVDGQRRAPLDAPSPDRPLAEIVAERLNEFADMRAKAAGSARFTGGRRKPVGPARPDIVASNLDRTVGALGPFGETYELRGGKVSGIDQTRTIASRLSALFQSIGYTPDGSGAEFLKGKIVPSNDLVADVMGEMISAIKSLNRADSPLTSEHRAELGAIVLELSRILHDVADPRTREALKRVTRKPTIGYGDNQKKNPYFGTSAEGSDVFYPGGAEDPFSTRTTDASGEPVRPNARVRRIAAAQIGQVPSSSQGEEPSVNRPLAIDQAGIYPELESTGRPDLTSPVQVSRLQQAVDEIGVYGETDKAAVNLDIDVADAGRDYALVREAISRTVNSELSVLLDLDGILGDIKGVSSLTPLERRDFGAPIGFRTDVPYRSNLFVRTQKGKAARRNKAERPTIQTSDPTSLADAKAISIAQEIERKIGRAKVLFDAINSSETVTSSKGVAAKARLRSWIKEARATAAALRQGAKIDASISQPTRVLDDYDSIIDMPVGERTGAEQLGMSQEMLISKTKLLNRKLRGFTIVRVLGDSVTIKTPAYARVVSDRRRGRMSIKYDQLVADFGEDFAKAYMASDEASTMFGAGPDVADTITLPTGDYIVPEQALPAFTGVEGVEISNNYDLRATLSVSPKYIVLKNGTIVSARSQEGGFISHRRVLPFRVREVRGGIFTEGQGLAEERLYEIEKLDQANYDTSDPSVRNDAKTTAEVIRKLDAWYGGELDAMELADQGILDAEIGTLVTDLEEIIASDAYSALEILAANGDSFPELESELLRAVAEVHGEVRADRIPQYSKYRLSGVPTVDRGGLRGAVYKVQDAVRAVRPGIPQLESKMGVQTVDDIINLESRLVEPVVVDDNVNINSVRRGVSFLYRLAYESGIQLGYGGVGTPDSRQIIIADGDSAKALLAADGGVIEQINDAGLLAARASVEAAKAILHSGWSEGLDPKYTRNRFETVQDPVGTIRQAPDGQPIPAGSMDTQESALRIRRYIPGMEDTGITLRPTDTSTSLYMMRASGALGDKATKFFNRYFEQAGLLDPKNQGALEGFSSEDSVQILSELEAAYRAGGSRLQTADQPTIEFKVLDRETPGEATLRVLKAIAAVDEKARATAKVKANAAPVTEAPRRNTTVFDAADGLTDEGVLIEGLDDYSWSTYDEEDGFTPAEADTAKRGRSKIYTMNAKKLAKIIAFKITSQGGITEGGVRETLKQIFLDEDIKGILPSSREVLDSMFLEVYKDLSGRLMSSVKPMETIFVQEVVRAAGREYTDGRLIRVAVDAEPVDGRPKLDIVVQGAGGKVEKILVTEDGRGMVAAKEAIPLLRQGLDYATSSDLELVAKPLYEALFEAAPLVDRPETADVPSLKLPKGRYAHGPFGKYYEIVIRAIEQGRVPNIPVELPSDLGEEFVRKAQERSNLGQPTEGAFEVDANDMDSIMEQQYDVDGPVEFDDNTAMFSKAIEQGKLASLLRPDQGLGMLGKRTKAFDMRLRTPVGGGAAGAALDIGMQALGGNLTPESAIISAGLNATNLLSKSPIKAGLIGSVASLGVTAATGGDIGRTIFSIAGSIAGGVLGGAFTGGIGAFGGSVGGSLVADELWKSMFGQQQSNTPLFKPFNPGANAPTVRIP